MLPRSLLTRLTLLFAGIVTAAIGVVYLAVVPPLEGQLRAQAVAALAARAAPQAAELVPVRPGGQAQVEGRAEAEGRAAVRRAAAATGARVTVFDVAPGTRGQRLTVQADSQPGASPAAEDLTFAEAASRAGVTQSGTQPTRGSRIAEVAIPLMGERGRVVGVAVFSDDLGAVDENVALIRRRILLWGFVALVVAIGAGALLARSVSKRAQRLERVARRVASGDFSSRIVDPSPDELGRLAAAFADMQRQLAGLQSARTQFIATASHELRTPLFSIGGFLELLEDEELDEPTRAAFLAQVRGQVDRLTVLATELLDLSRLDADALGLSPEPTDVGELVRDVVTALAPRARQSGHEVELDTARAAGEFECDPERVSQVLRILLDNALVHTPAGTAIRVSAEIGTGGARMTVADGGPGIQRDVLEQIFQPFFTGNTDGQGAGLGLAIASELADRMDGVLSASSRSGATAFTLELPT